MTGTLLETSHPIAPTIHRLANGLTMIAEQMPVEAVNLNVWFGVGSAIESDEINGMAHFLEHMVFKGTANLKPGEFDTWVEERGAVMNAATSQDYTHYFITAAPKDFAELAPLQLEVATQPSIPDGEFDRERLVVLEEIRRSHDNPMRRTFARAMEVCFEELPYRRPVLGPAEVIGAVTPSQMREFHNHYYRPYNTTVAVVGNIPVEEAIATVEAAMGGIDGGSHSAAAILKEEPPFSEVIRREYEDKTLQQARLILMWRVPGMQRLEQTYALDAIAAILGQGKTSRLFRDLREERQLVSSISVVNATQRWQGYFYIAARLPEENLSQVEAAITDHLQRLQDERVLNTELDRIRTRVTNRFIFGNEKPSDRANLYGYYHSLLGDLTPAFEYPQRIQAIEAQDIQQGAIDYLSPEAYGAVVVRPGS